MQSLMPAKHRCGCFSQQSSSFLYGLRREAPSTQRVLLERLLNILSRAAAHKSKNPQRLWADSERPEWWTEVTDLKWKNPREHPKDNKETLKKKIEVLERELTNRKLMNEDLKAELEAHRGSKKVDLELKSDFEAVIAKASGLHYMLDKVSTKMEQSRSISDKIATYIRETRDCLDQCLTRISSMYQQVEAREKRKSSLWEQMGVSKRQRSEVPEDFETDCLELDFDDIPAEAFHIIESFSPASPFSSSPLSPSPTSVLPVSPPVEKISDVNTDHMTQQPNPCSFSPLPGTRNAQVLSVAAASRRSLSQPTCTHTASEGTLQVMDLSVGKSVHLSVPSLHPSAKKSRRYSADEEEEDKEKEPEATRVQSAPLGILLQTPKMKPVVEDVVVVDDDDDVIVVENAETSQSRSSAVGGLSASVGPLFRGGGAGSEGAKSIAEASEVQRRKDRGKHRRNPHDRPKSLGARDKQRLTLPAETAVAEHRRYSSLPSDPAPPCLLSSISGVPFADSAKPPRRVLREQIIVAGAGVTATSVGHASSSWGTSPLSADDLSVDSAEMSQHDLDNVEAIIEDSPTPTFSMYAADGTADMDHLAEMTTALSCDDLRPSVTEPVMRDLSDEQPRCLRSLSGPDRVQRGHREGVHRFAAAVSGLSSADADDQSLSKAIGGLRESLFH